MSHFVTFRGYGIGAHEVTLAVERVTDLRQIESSGGWGVEITLDTGRTIVVSGFASDVRKTLEAAAEELRGSK